MAPEIDQSVNFEPGSNLIIAKVHRELSDGCISRRRRGPGLWFAIFGKDGDVCIAPTIRKEVYVAADATGHVRDHPGSLRVLVAEDNADTANTLASLLASWGYEVQVVYDGQAALDSAQKQPPDVALVDLGLPAMDGYQVALNLRRRPDLKGLKLIAVTGFQDTRSRCEEYGFDEHLIKPIDPEQLHALMAKLDSDQIGEAGTKSP